jgi:hypothetical protein
MGATGIEPMTSYRVKVIETGYVLGSSRLFLSDGELRYSAEN